MSGIYILLLLTKRKRKVDDNRQIAFIKQILIKSRSVVTVADVIRYIVLVFY